MHIRRKTGFFALFLITTFSLFACGGGGGGSSSSPPPTVTTLAATGISVHSAILNGTVNPLAQATNAWLEWGTDNTLSTPALTPAQAIGAGTTDQSVSATITGLTSGTIYYYRVAATNVSGTQKGAIASFTTSLPNSPPAVTTNAATSVTISGAVLNGTVIPNELATTAVFEWGTDSNLTIPTLTPVQSLGAGTTSVAINASLPGLIPGTTYYFRVAATNSAGTTKGLIGSFSTVAQPPTVTTAAATSVTINSATLNGTVNPNGLAVNDAHFEYGTDSALASLSTTPSQAMGSGFTGESINATVSLAAGTTYYFRVVATNSAGTSKGTIVSFDTPQYPSPTANAGSEQTVYMAGPYMTEPTGGYNGFLGSTVVTLDGSGSSGQGGGSILTWVWTQIGGAHTVTISDDNTSATATFTAPVFSYGENDNLVFQLNVTDNRGQSSTDNVWKNVKWGFLDDFSTDSTGTYDQFQTLGSGSTFTYDSGGKRARVQTGVGKGFTFSKNFKMFPVEDINLYTNTGVFSLDFNPVAQFGSGGDVSIRLLDAFDTYYELSTNPALVKKVRAGVTVDSAPFPFTYSQGGTYPIKITFSPEITTFEAFGGTATLTINTSSNNVVYFEVETNQQNAYFDNIKLEAAP